MTTELIAPLPKLRFVDTASGVALVGGLLFTYAAGTTNKQNTYTDSAGGTPNNNPIVLDARGECNCWFDPTLAYKLTLAPAGDSDPPSNPIWSVDQLVGSAALATLAASSGASLVGFIQAGTGAVARTVQAKERDIINANDFSTLQQAITAAAGRILFGAGAVFTVTAALAFPSNIELMDMTITGNEATANTATTSSKSNITLTRVKMNSSGTYSNVWTWTLCDRITYNDCWYDGKLTGSVLGSTALRFNGCTNVTINGGFYYDTDTFIYLDKSGATNSDKVRVTGAYFAHTFLGTTNNPTGVYQFNCDNVTVDTCTFVDIAAGGSAPIVGYSVYEGDGTASTLLVTNCTTKMTIAKPHIMVQNSNAKYCEVTNNRYLGKAIGTGVQTSSLYKGGATLGHLLLEGNYSEQGDYFITGGGAAGTAMRDARVHDNKVIKLEQNTAAIRIGVSGANYVGYCSVRGNTLYCTYASSINISNCVEGVVSENHCMNWNTQNHADHAIYSYTAGIYWQGATPKGIIRDNILENDTLVGGETGFCDYGMVADTLSPNLKVIDNFVGTMIDARSLNIVENSGTYTPTLTNSTNLDASTANVTPWSRNGSVVTVAGTVSIDPTAAGPTATQLGISLPVASNFANAVQAGGTAASGATETETFSIYSDATNDRVVMDGLARNTANHSVSFQFTYLIV